MRPLSATSYGIVWALAAAGFVAASVEAFLRGQWQAGLAGLVVVCFLALLSLKKTYRNRVSALGALVTLGMAAFGYLAGLGAAAMNDMLLLLTAWASALVIFIAITTEIVDIRYEVRTLAEQGKRRRINWIFIVFSLLCIGAGTAVLVQGVVFGGVWLVVLGVMRGALEVAT